VPERLPAWGAARGGAYGVGSLGGVLGALTGVCLGVAHGGARPAGPVPARSTRCVAHGWLEALELGGRAARGERGGRQGVGCSVGGGLEGGMPRAELRGLGA
jgi:hypothetical protein